ncbi:hypothetical protein AKJ47_02620, partial [candidate division MSBL1 archaeon SCGC-AAA261G05]
MLALRDLGITTDTPTEVILSTFSPEGEPHASSVGVWRVEEGVIGLKLFTRTQSFHNLSRSGTGVINIVNSARILAEQGLPEILVGGEALKFEASENVDAPRLQEADAFIEFEVEQIEKETISDRISTSELAQIAGNVKHIEAKKLHPHPFKRTEFFLIESAIIASRALEAKKKGKKRLVRSLVREINYYKDKCEKTAPGTPEAELITKILKNL